MCRVAVAGAFGCSRWSPPGVGSMIVACRGRHLSVVWSLGPSGLVSRELDGPGSSVSRAFFARLRMVRAPGPRLRVGSRWTSASVDGASGDASLLAVAAGTVRIGERPSSEGQSGWFGVRSSRHSRAPGSPAPRVASATGPRVRVASGFAPGASWLAFSSSEGGSAARHHRRPLVRQWPRLSADHDRECSWVSFVQKSLRRSACGQSPECQFVLLASAKGSLY
jgi:hypothetical protein